MPSSNVSSSCMTPGIDPPLWTQKATSSWPEMILFWQTGILIGHGWVGHMIAKISIVNRETRPYMIYDVNEMNIGNTELSFTMLQQGLNVYNLLFMMTDTFIAYNTSDSGVNISPCPYTSSHYQDSLNTVIFNIGIPSSGKIIFISKWTSQFPLSLIVVAMW